MQYSLKTSLTCLLLTSLTFLSGCVTTPAQQEILASVDDHILVTLNQYASSDFKQVEGTFYTAQSRGLVFRVLSDTAKTSKWFERVESLQVLTVYNNQQYLLRTVINSPWPFKNRELITCVNTSFEENTTNIEITSCSERVPIDDTLVRIVEVASNWTIKTLPNALVEVNYKTWINPEGNVPAFIFNNELIDSTLIDLKKLQKIINNASLEQYYY